MYKAFRTFLLPLLALSITVLAAPSGNAAELKRGMYKGKATTAMFLYGMSLKSTGIMKLTITGLDARGRIKADVEFYNGLTGEGKLIGVVDRAGQLRFQGIVDAIFEYEFTMRAVVGDKGEIIGRYTLVYNQGFGGKSVQEGKCVLEYDGDD